MTIDSGSNWPWFFAFAIALIMTFLTIAAHFIGYLPLRPPNSVLEPMYLLYFLYSIGLPSFITPSRIAIAAPTFLYRMASHTIARSLKLALMSFPCANVMSFLSRLYEYLNYFTARNL